MSEYVKMITVLEMEQAEQLKNNKRLVGVDTMPQLDSRIKEFIRKYITKTVGYQDAPIAGLSKFEGSPADLKKVGTGAADFISGKSGSVFLEVHMPSDMIVSVPYSVLLESSSAIKRADDEFEVEMILEDLEEHMMVGFPSGEAEEAISFISFIDVRKCKFLYVVGKDWETEEFNIPGVEKITPANMNYF